MPRLDFRCKGCSRLLSGWVSLPMTAADVTMILTANQWARVRDFATSYFLCSDCQSITKNSPRVKEYQYKQAVRTVRKRKAQPVAYNVSFRRHKKRR